MKIEIDLSIKDYEDEHKLLVVIGVFVFVVIILLVIFVPEDKYVPDDYNHNYSYSENVCEEKHQSNQEVK